MSNYADYILKSNCIFTATSESPISGYIAIKNDRILSIGNDSIPSEIMNEKTEIFNLGDCTITPGFSDVHCFLQVILLDLLELILQSLFQQKTYSLH